MKATTSAILTLALSAAAAPAFAQSAAKPATPVKPVTVTIINAANEPVGTATFSEAPKGVKITLDIKNLPPGQHLMHVHEFPKCEAPDFKSAGPHFNSQHNVNLDGSMGPMAGDIPHFELTVAENGTAHVNVIAPGVTMGDEPNSIFANGGTSIVIHDVAKTVTDNAPPRIACGVITKK
jgi:superoxide dismutase, Cu-Zn family